ncbi:GCNT1-like protein [Mya arenaria]|uniref:GCNT1-like protein n=1 Tax=Mya arenaria TaxID=6604 RepID=A0ABY7DV97_MYAAR|nr:GCNT1-like protein [Mya arenaria]
MIRVRRLRVWFLLVFLVFFTTAPYFWMTNGRVVHKDVFYNEPMRIKEGHIAGAVTVDRSLIADIQYFKCDKLFANDLVELTKASAFLQQRNFTFPRRPDENFIELTMNCDNFKESRGYFVYPPTQEEKSFPIAFNILFHQNVEQLERLLRAIYRPQNQYCIHVDGKTSEDVLNIVTQIAYCFPNVFIATELEIVIYASATRLSADINCMKDHVNKRFQWYYLLNLASSEYPIMTNLQIVQILKQFNGSNDIHEVFSTMDEGRFKKKHYTFIDLYGKSGYMIHTDKQKEPPPHNLKITKGNAYNIFSRAFVEWFLSNPIARDLLAWSMDTLTPDEHFWATLNNLYSNPHLKTPGGYTGHPDTKPFFARYIGWNSSTHRERCKMGHYVHNICVFSVLDLPNIKDRYEIIANKFDIEYDPIAYRCMEEFILNNVLNEKNISNNVVYPAHFPPSVPIMDSIRQWKGTKQSGLGF